MAFNTALLALFFFSTLLFWNLFTSHPLLFLAPCNLTHQKVTLPRGREYTQCSTLLNKNTKTTRVHTTSCTLIRPRARSYVFIFHNNNKLEPPRFISTPQTQRLQELVEVSDGRSQPIGSPGARGRSQWEAVIGARATLMALRGFRPCQVINVQAKHNRN